MNVSIDIGIEFSRYPGGRYIELGDFSGEEFRDVHLIPALDAIEKGEHLTIILDNALGYSSSFLEETFGGLVRKGFDANYIKDHIIFDTSKSLLEAEIWEYIMSAMKDVSKPVS